MSGRCPKCGSTDLWDDPLAKQWGCRVCNFVEKEAPEELLSFPNKPRIPNYINSGVGKSGNPSGS